MVLTTERAEQLANYITADSERANQLAELTAEEAAAKINEEGFDFSAEELKEFCKQLQKVSVASNADGELSEDALEDVSGGVIAAAAATVYLACITGGFAFGTALAKNYGW